MVAARTLGFCRKNSYNVCFFNKSNQMDSKRIPNGFQTDSKWCTFQAAVSFQEVRRHIKRPPMSRRMAVRKVFLKRVRKLCVLGGSRFVMKKEWLLDPNAKFYMTGMHIQVHTGMYILRKLFGFSTDPTKINVLIFQHLLKRQQT